MKKKPVEEKQKPKEKLSAADLRELMGVDKDTYKRVRGAIRRKR